MINKIEDFKRFVAIDIETTGLGVREDIIEIAVVDINENVIIDQKIFPYSYTSDQLGDLPALKMNHFEFEVWKKYGVRWADEVIDFWTYAMKKLKGKVAICCNSGFDIGNIRNTCEHFQIENTLYYRAKDISSMAFPKLGMNLKNYSLKALAAHYGIVNEKAHSAAADALTTMRVFKKLCNLPLSERKEKEITLFDGVEE
jgi:DNA polymerase III epsilon subunit-like protein